MDWTERPEVRLAPEAGPQDRQATDFAQLGAEIAATIPDVDKAWAHDLFAAQAALGRFCLKPGEALTVGVTVGAKDNNKVEFTSGRVIAGHDVLRAGRNTVPETDICADMYQDRTPSWWNKRCPEGAGNSALVRAPLQLLAVSALRGLPGTWNEQQAKLRDLLWTDGTNTVEGMAPLDYVLLDTSALISGGKRTRPDVTTFTRFVQHEQDRTGIGGVCGPFANVDGAQLGLGGSDGGRDPVAGFRVVRGQSEHPQDAPYTQDALRP